MEEENKILVAIVMGSDSDWKNFADDADALCEILNECGIGWEKTTLSAHRNPEEVGPYVKGAGMRGVQIFIAAASMSAHLAGSIAAHGRDMLVIGVPLPSKERPDARDAIEAMLQMPPGVPVAVPGIMGSGLQKAGVLAAQVLGLWDWDSKKSGEIKRRLKVYLAKQKDKKPARIGFETSKSHQKGE
jgi:5-(carboxyamino)imidazole ribonucleotide mutase